MERFYAYTAKIDEIHFSDRDSVVNRTLCSQEMTSANYYENLRFMNIDVSRKIKRGTCPTCLERMLSNANSTIHNLSAEIDGWKSMCNKAEKEVVDLLEVISKKETATTPITIEEPIIELFEDGKFTDGKSLEDVPKCAIPGCKSEEVRYWIHPKDKECKYFCGDCPESEIEKLDKFAASIGEEVGSYDPPLWAVEMILHHNEKNTKVWLIKAHNMAHAIQRAAMGDFDLVSEEDPDRVNQADLIPIDIRKANEEEEKRFGV